MQKIVKIILILVSFIFLTSQTPVSKFTAQVTDIIDGDTIKILYAGEQITVRLNHIDCPEYNHPFGERSKLFVMALLSGETVSVLPAGRDIYNRLLAEIYLPNGENVNLEIVKNGFGIHYKKYSSDLRYAEAENYATILKKGIWNHPEYSDFTQGINTAPSYAPAITTVAPALAPTSSQSDKQTTVYITKTGAKYHRSGCRSLRKSSIPISLEDAKNRGYGPCSICRPPQ